MSRLGRCLAWGVFTLTSISYLYPCIPPLQTSFTASKLSLATCLNQLLSPNLQVPTRALGTRLILCPAITLRTAPLDTGQVFQSTYDVV